MNYLMVVDDEEGVRRSLRKVLAKDGYEVITAETGEEALKIVADRKHDLETVISDFKMPGMDGLQTLVEIGRMNSEITRIMLTGYATMESAIAAVNAGIDGFLTKPFENIEIRAKVREYNIKKRLKSFVSVQILNELQKGNRTIAPRRQKVSVLFSDIRGFSEIAEKMSAQELADMMNDNYFEPLDNIVYECDGTLDKHIGDSIMGVFGSPLSHDDDSYRAVSCAIRMKEAMKAVNENLPGNRYLNIGIGISTGEAMAGIFGSSHKKEYTVFGPTVNLASRLEKLAQENQILICEETYQQVRHLVSAEPVYSSTEIKGIERKINIYSVIDHIK
jgi:adenylate cyclase